MNQEWQDPTDDMPDGWYWCECLDVDQPPQLLWKRNVWSRDAVYAYGRLKSISEPRRSSEWQRWTIAGWVPLVGRVAACTGRLE